MSIGGSNKSLANGLLSQLVFLSLAISSFNLISSYTFMISSPDKFCLRATCLNSAPLLGCQKLSLSYYHLYRPRVILESYRGENHLARPTRTYFCHNHFTCVIWTERAYRWLTITRVTRATGSECYVQCGKSF